MKYDKIPFSMNLKELPNVVAIVLSQWLRTTDLLSLISTSSEVNELLSYRFYWLLKARQCGIYRAEFEALDLPMVKGHVVRHLQCIYREMRKVHPIDYAKSLTNILMDDDPKELELLIAKTAKKSSAALLPIAMQFGRVRIMHSLFEHINPEGIFQWLLHAIRYERYAAVKYLVEVRQVPLMTNKRFALFASINSLWDPSYVLLDASGRRHRATFCHYNELLLREIINCRHPLIVQYLKPLINELLETGGIAAPDRYLVALMNRHSLSLVKAEPDDHEPALTHKLGP